MKTKLIYALLLSIFCLNAYAESQYKSYFGDTYTKWNLWLDNEYVSTDSFLSCCERTQTIDNKTYYCLFNVYEYDGEITSVDENEPCQLFLREEIETGRLYYRNNMDNGFSDEILVSDMSLEIGDSIRLGGRSYWSNLNIPTDENTVYALVDSIYYHNNLKHIRTKTCFYSIVSGKTDTLVFIEGIGSNAGPLLDYYTTGQRSQEALSCYHKDGSIISFSEEGCLFFTLNKVEENEKGNIEYVINKDNIYIQFSDFYTGVVSLYGITGNLLHEVKISNVLNYDINAQYLQSGLYILMLRNEIGKLFVVKIEI